MYDSLRGRLPQPVKTALKWAARGAINLEAVRRALYELWNEIKIAWMSWAGQQTLSALSARRELQVHLGCGTDIRPGWVNIDLAVTPPHNFDAAANPNTVLLSYDLRRGLPIQPESCAFIYSSHFFEHLEYKHGLRLMQDCYRALKPGGIFRLCMPNYRACFEAYLRNDRDFFSLIDYALVEPGQRLIADYMTYSIYQYGEHKCVYDEERLHVILSRIGFQSVETSAFREDLDIGAELRRKYSFYIQAVK